MQEKYSPAEVEQSAQNHWTGIDAYKAVENDRVSPKAVLRLLDAALSFRQLPHGPCAQLHDQRRHVPLHRMNGYKMLMPMGWDAFGLPAENAAMANGVPRRNGTCANIAYMKKQMAAWACDRLVARNDRLHRILQMEPVMFLKMLEKGVIYKEKNRQRELGFR